jgi:hypothetical protein
LPSFAMSCAYEPALRAMGQPADTLKDFDDEAGAIKAGHRVVASPMVGRPDEVLGIVHRDGAVVIGADEVLLFHAPIVRDDFFERVPKSPK